MTNLKRLFAAILLSSAVFAAEWPHFLGPTYNGTSSETGLLHEFPPQGPAKLWEYPKGKGHSVPAISSGLAVVFHTVDEDETVDAIDITTGERKWRFSYEAPYTPQFGGGNGPCTNPTIANGRVFTLGINSLLHCLELKTGELLWKRDLAREYKLSPTFFGQGGTPCVIGKLLIVSLGTSDDKSLVALDASTGEEVWATKHTWGSSYASPIPASIRGRECILAFQGGMSDPPTGGLLVIDAKTGEVLSATPHRAKMYASVSVSSPVVSGNRVFVGEAYTEGGICIEIAPDFSAKVVWRAPKFDPYLVTPVSQEGNLYAFVGQHQQNAELACYEIATGKETWRNDLGGKFQRASLLRADGGFLCLGENGDLAWLDLSATGPTIRSQTKLFNAAETWTPPVISDARLFVCQNEAGSGGTKRRVVCYDLRGAR